jgi:hypothetical protein
MASNRSFLDNVISGASNPKGNLADFQHASRLYVGDSFRLAPKQKFLYHVTFNINPKASSVIPQLTEKHQNELNMLVKAVDLPKFSVDVDIKHQYNKKKVVQKRIDYDPVTVTFHDDNFGVTTAMWEAYYRYYFKDGNYAEVDSAGNPLANVKGYKQASDSASPYNKGNAFGGEEYNKFRYGFDNDSFEPFFRSIVIYQLSRKRYTAFTLINPIISKWQHDSMDQSVSDFVQSVMSIDYETVFYTRGPVAEGSAPRGFAQEHYDTTPSPNSLAGGGSTSVFGSGGVLAGGSDVLNDIISGDAFANPGALLGTVLKAKNTVTNAKAIGKGGLRQEGFGILKDAIGAVGGIDVSGVSNSVFSKSGGNGGLKDLAIAGALVGGSALLQGKSLSDITTSVTGTPNATSSLAKATTFMKTHLQNGGSPDPQDISSAYDNLSDNAKQNANDSAVNALKNIR